MILPVKGRVPPSDGTSHWRYPVAPGVILRAKGHQELTEAIFEYRLRNNIPPGNIEVDIANFYCGLYPSFCHAERADTDPSIPRVSSEPMLNRVSRWASITAHAMPRGGLELVTKAEAERRAVICAACPKQANDWRGGCGGCSATTMQILQQLKKLKSTPVDGNLGACSVAGWFNGSSVWLPVEALAVDDQQKAAMPEACWRKSLP